MIAIKLSCASFLGYDLLICLLQKCIFNAKHCLIQSYLFVNDALYVVMLFNVLLIYSLVNFTFIRSLVETWIYNVFCVCL